MSFASTSCSMSALGSAPETSASPPVLAKGTASDVRMATRMDECDGIYGLVCRGGPPWPPVAEIKDLMSKNGRPRRAAPTKTPAKRPLLALHRSEKLGVGLRLLEPFE